MRTILLIDDHQEFREFLGPVLEEAGFDVVAVRCPDDAFRALRKGESPDLIVSDLEMPFTLSKDFFDFQYSYEVGFRTIEELRWVFPNVPLIAITALPDSVVAEARVRMPDIPLLRKPFSHHAIIDLARTMVDEPAAALMQ